MVDDLVFGKDVLPQYAGTKQRVLAASLELDDGKPIRILRTEGSIWAFDENGSIEKGLHDTMALAMDSLPTPPDNGDRVVQFRTHTTRRKLEKEHNADIERVIADIWPKRKTDRLKSAVGTAQRTPPLSFDATNAINEISRTFWTISNAIDRLKEPSQKAFGFEARQRPQRDPQYSGLYRAIADMSDWQLELQRRRRTGKGVWYAVVCVIVWLDGTGDTVERYHERCGSRDEAVTAVRRLLAEHASKFDEITTLEPELLTDMEWEQLGYPD
ncbi:hypothetical protein C7I85_22710 [Mesorhizobium soli]|uniref:Uncharacterized protein n=1 Tax=Pseudaminobacter soli (ex Li et al. 2025) TaxID=1295366 RepID=A0A2P7S4Q1_9HYPH|nr:hypothetical protein C7I85_22710 [Mesorhizobium soli]